MPLAHVAQYWLQNRFQPQEVSVLRNCLEAISVVLNGVEHTKKQQFEQSTIATAVQQKGAQKSPTTQHNVQNTTKISCIYH